MNLTADTFVQIVQSLRSDGSCAAGRELRTNPRVGVTGRTLVMIPAKFGGKLFHAQVRDLSAKGIALMFNEPLVAKGDEFLLVLPEGPLQGRRAVQYVVRRVGKVSDKLHSVGAQLVREVMMDHSAVPKPAAAAPAVATPHAAAVSHAVAAEVTLQDVSAVELEQRLKAAITA